MDDEHTFHFRVAGLDGNEEFADFNAEPIATSNESSQSVNRGRVMSGTLLRPDRQRLAHTVWLEPRLQRMRPLLSVLLIEYRDEVFARLESDLRQLGCQVYRASRAEDVLHIYINTTIDVTISNSALPDASAWLTAAKLRMYDRTARIWLYTVNRSIRDRNWAALSGIEKVIRYDGNLFKLTERIAMLLASSQVQSDSRQSGMKGSET